jgi:predicted cobalt transporter CbtA
MIKTLVVRGLVAGLIAGLIAGAFAFTIGEPLIDDAIAIEEANTPASLASAEPPLVSRGGQKAGLFLATGLYGLALGGLFALAFAAMRGRVRAHNDLWLSLGLAGALFSAIVLVPFLKYPANPPAVGDPETITERTLLYFTVVATSLLGLLAAWRVARRVPGGAPPWIRPAAAIGVFVGTVALVATVLPGVNEVAKTFPADLLWDFRLASLGMHAVLWGSLAFVFGATMQRAAASARTA